MHIVDALLAEHAPIVAIFDHVEESLTDATDIEAVRGAVAALSAALVSHARAEDDLLFPALRADAGVADMIRVMSEEHEEVDRLLRSALRQDSAASALDAVRQAIGIARDHFEREEQALFPDARSILGEATCLRLGASWARLRRISIE